MTDNPTTTDAAWANLIAAIRAWEPHMDQWERLKVEGGFNPLYVSIRLAPDAPEEAYDVVKAA